MWEQFSVKAEQTKNLIFILSALMKLICWVLLLQFHAFSCRSYEEVQIQYGW